MFSANSLSSIRAISLPELFGKNPLENYFQLCFWSLDSLGMSYISQRFRDFHGGAEAGAARCVSARECRKSGCGVEEEAQGPGLLNASSASWIILIKPWVERTKVWDPCAALPGPVIRKVSHRRWGEASVMRAAPAQSFGGGEEAFLPVDLVAVVEGTESLSL